MIKVIKESRNSRSQGFSYYFCLIEESGSRSVLVPRTNWSGSGGPKHTDPMVPDQAPGQDPQHCKSVLRIRITLMQVLDQLLIGTHKTKMRLITVANPEHFFTLIRVRIRLLIKVMQICDHWITAVQTFLRIFWFSPLPLWASKATHGASTLHSLRILTLIQVWIRLFTVMRILSSPTAKFVRNTLTLML